MKWILADGMGLMTEACKKCGHRPAPGEAIALLTHLQIARCARCVGSLPDGAVLEQLQLETQQRVEALAARVTAAAGRDHFADNLARSLRVEPLRRRAVVPYHKLPKHIRRREASIAGQVNKNH